jgi:hypothetical protein
MKNIYDVMRQKELDIERLKKEIEAIRFVVPMLGDDETAGEMLAPIYSPNQQSSKPVIAAKPSASRSW